LNLFRMIVCSVSEKQKVINTCSKSKYVTLYLRAFREFGR